MVDMMHNKTTQIKTEPSEENFQLTDKINEDLTKFADKGTKINQNGDKKHTIVNIKIEESEDAEKELTSTFIKVEELSDIELDREEDYMFIKPEELNIKEEDKNYFLCDCCEKNDVAFCPKCTLLVVIKDNPVRMGMPNRAAQSVPKGTLELKTSPIHGRGIFAQRSLRKGVQLGPYEGKTIKVNSTEGYSWKVDGGRLVDTSDNADSNYLRYINSAKDVSERNLVAFQFKGELHYRTSRTVKKGEELLVYFDNISADSYFKPQEESFEEKFYTCEFCHVGMKFEQHRDKHQKFCKFQPNRRKIDGETFQCRKCQYFVTNLNFLIVHERMCTKRKSRLNDSTVKRHACDYCNYSTNRRAHLNLHTSAKHERKDLFKCSECDYNTYSKLSLYQHRRQHRVKAFRCPVCHTGFQYKLHVDGHILSQHPELSHIITRPIHKCSDCSYATVRKSHLTRHMLKHERPEQSYKCEKCNYKTNERSHLRRHVFTHTETKLWICSECRKGFNHKTTLDSHILKSHSDNEELLKSITQKILACDVCNYRCLYTSHFKQHMKIHKKNGKSKT